MTVVPYRSSQESLTNLLGGHLDVMAATTPNILAQLQAGKIRTLAVASKQRLQGPLSSIPTWRELGVDADYESAQGVMTAQGVPPEAVAFWDGFFRTVTAEKEWKDFVVSRQWAPRSLGAADTVAELTRAYADTRSVLQDLGLAKR
jgi:putative tricarboxylic transport membrane protein